MSKICKKGYIEMTKKIYLETLKRVLGHSILHYLVGGEKRTGVENVIKEQYKLWKYHLDQRCDYHWQETFTDSVIFIMTSPTNNS